jgi:hypothetical protein
MRGLRVTPLSGLSSSGDHHYVIVSGEEGLLLAAVFPAALFPATLTGCVLQVFTEHCVFSLRIQGITRI